MNGATYMKKIWLRALGLVGIPLALMFLWQLAVHSGGLWRALAKEVGIKIEETINPGEEETTKEEVVFDLNQRY